MTTSISERVVEKLRTLLPPSPLDAQPQRGHTASEVLFLEAIQVAVQEGWFDHARFLMDARTVDTQAALKFAEQTHAAIGSPEVVVDSIAGALKAVDELSLKLLPIGSPNRKFGSVPDNEILDVAAQFIELVYQQIKILPKEISYEVDVFLCVRHRSRVLEGATPEPGGLLNQRLHDCALLGLAMSGGGIRSASFSVGVLQSLAKRSALPAFNYISSVSGGGYAASWYMAWAYRHKEGTEGVSKELGSPQGTESGPLWWVRRHSSYLAPRLSLASTSDAVALVVAYVFNWLPVFALICSALMAALAVPHVIAQWARELVQASAAIQSIAFGTSATALVVLIGGLRRLTMYYRQPTRPTRNPSGLAVTVFAWYTLAALVLSTTAPLLANARASGALHRFWFQVSSFTLDGFIATFVFWLLAYLLGMFVAWLLSLELVSRLIDLWRAKILDQTTLPRQPLRRLPVPRHLMVIGVCIGAFLGASVTEYMLTFTSGNGIERYVTVVGPMAIFQLLAASELSNAFMSNAYMREIDRAWSARVGAWMISGAAIWMACSAMALLPDDAFAIWAGLRFELKLVWFCTFSLVIVALVQRQHFIALYVLFAIAFVAMLSVLVVSPLMSWWGGAMGQPMWVALSLLSLLTLSLAGLINVNRFSLHSLYREGLVRTFLGASRLGQRNRDVQAPPRPTDDPISDEERPQFESRSPDPVTSIDDDDNPAIAWLRSHPTRPLPVFLLNAAVNGQSAHDVDGRVPRQWPYTFSQYFCGSPADGIGYSPSDRVFSRGRKKPLSLGTAMAVSGAAVSPTAGRTTHPVKAFVFGLLNARLGLWVGNPQYPDTVPLEKPGLKGLAVLSEVLGVRRRFKSWIHLSDGGHFENLGVYELLRRGCSRIVAIDGSCDPAANMSDLANAIRRARIDLGIVVRNPTEKDFAHDEDASSTSTTTTLEQYSQDAVGSGNAVWRWFTIDYGKDLPLGRLLYIKPSLAGTSMIPIEVHQYSKVSPSFPHETTADQFFSEAQMEAYRSLGYACGEEAFQSVLELGNARSRSVDVGLAFRLPQRFKRAPGPYP